MSVPEIERLERDIPNALDSSLLDPRVDAAVTIAEQAVLTALDRQRREMTAGKMPQDEQR